MNAFDIFAAIWLTLVTWRVAVIVRQVLRKRALDRQVVQTYETLLSSPNRQALYDYWKKLNDTCRPGNLCIECEREILAQGEP